MGVYCTHMHSDVFYSQCVRLHVIMQQISELHVSVLSLSALQKHILSIAPHLLTSPLQTFFVISPQSNGKPHYVLNLIKIQNTAQCDVVMAGKYQPIYTV